MYFLYPLFNFILCQAFKSKILNYLKDLEVLSYSGIEASSGVIEVAWLDPTYTFDSIDFSLKLIQGTQAFNYFINKSIEAQCNNTKEQVISVSSKDSANKISFTNICPLSSYLLKSTVNKEGFDSVTSNLTVTTRKPSI